MLAKRDKYAIACRNKAPKKEDGHERTERTIIGGNSGIGWFVLIHDGLWFVYIGLAPNVTT
jgi:hypothetical protein